MNLDRPSDAAPLDLASLREVFEDDDAGLIEFVDDALPEIAASLERLAGAAQARDAATAASVAHAMKGAAGTIGARSIATPMQRVEDAVRSREWNLVVTETDTARAALTIVVRWVERRKADAS